jgi:hypothetical protein
MSVALPAFPGSTGSLLYPAEGPENHRFNLTVNMRAKRAHAARKLTVRCLDPEFAGETGIDVPPDGWKKKGRRPDG